MSATVGPPENAGVCIAIFFGLMIAFMGVMLYFILGDIIPTLVIIFLMMIAFGFLLFFVGVAKVPSARRESAKWKSIVEIAAVRKEVSISDLSYETGLDRKYIMKVLTQCLMNGNLYGYIEDELFVRDTAGRRYYVVGRRGLFEPKE